MTREQVDYYKTLIQRTTKSIVYFKQWTSWVNELDGTVLGRADYILQESWRLVLDTEHPIQSEFSELIFIR